MFTTGAGKPLKSLLGEDEQRIADELALPSSLFKVLQGNFKAASVLYSLPIRRSVEISLHDRMVKRFHHRTYLNSTLRKIASGDIPAGAHFVFVVSEVCSSHEVILSDFFQFMPMKSARKVRLLCGDFIRLQGARYEGGFLFGNPNGVTKVKLEVPARVDLFGTQTGLPPVPRLSSFVSGDIPYMRVVVYRDISGFWTIITASGERVLVGDKHKDEVFESVGDVSRVERNNVLIVTDPWGSRFARLNMPSLGDEDGPALRAGDSLDVINARLVDTCGKTSIYLSRASRVVRAPVTYYLSSVAPHALICDIIVCHATETCEGVFDCDGSIELRLDFKTGLFNPKRLLARARSQLLAPGRKTLKNLRKIDSQVFFADLLELEVLKDF